MTGFSLNLENIYRKIKLGPVKELTFVLSMTTHIVPNTLKDLIMSKVTDY